MSALVGAAGAQASSAAPCSDTFDFTKMIKAVDKIGLIRLGGSRGSSIRWSGALRRACRLEIGAADSAPRRERRHTLAAVGAVGDSPGHGLNDMAAAATAGSLARVKIAKSLYDEMVAHARADAPAECCGMVASRDGDAVQVYPAANAAASALRYEIDGAEQYRIQMAIDDQDLDLGAIYHSHTRSEPYPSQTDINLAFYPDALYIIVGLAGGEPDVRAFTIRDGQVAEAELVVV